MVSSLLVKGSDVVKVGQQVAVVEVGAAPAAAPAAAAAPPPPKQADAPKPAAPEPPKAAPKPAPKVRGHAVRYLHRSTTNKSVLYLTGPEDRPTAGG